MNALEAIADEAGTPFYAYDLDLLRERIRAFEASLRDAQHVTCYALKANDALALLAAVAAQGLGADVVSGGELEKALRAGFRPDLIVFSGVGKQRDEICAAIDAGIRSINLESPAELETIAVEAERRDRVANVSVRLNPDVAAGTHQYLTTGTAASKFGLGRADALAAARAAAADERLNLVGLSFHIGSQLLDASPVLRAAERAAELWRNLEAEGIELRDFNAGGGLGIAYGDGAEPDVVAYTTAIAEVARALDANLLLEPGRYLVAPVGTFVTRVLDVKHAGDRTVAVCDGGINDLIRPLLYGAEHPIRLLSDVERETVVVDVVGPLCESGDFLGLGRSLPLPVAGDLVAVELAGAYGRVMSSTYNARPLCAEVLLEGGTWRIGRERGRIEDLLRNESF